MTVIKLDQETPETKQIWKVGDIIFIKYKNGEKQLGVVCYNNLDDWFLTFIGGKNSICNTSELYDTVEELMRNWETETYLCSEVNIKFKIN